MITLLIVLILLFAASFFIGQYNKMKRKQLKVNESESNIDIYLNQRYDGISSMYKMVQEFKIHEIDILTEIVKLRKMASGASSFKEEVEINDEIDTKMPQVMAQLESYPELKSSELYLKIQEEIQNNEENISASKKSYNGYVNEYNTQIAVFPSNLMAGLYGYNREELIKIDSGKRSHPLL